MRGHHPDGRRRTGLHLSTTRRAVADGTTLCWCLRRHRHLDAGAAERRGRLSVPAAPLPAPLLQQGSRRGAATGHRTGRKRVTWGEPSGRLAASLEQKYADAAATVLTKT